MAVVAPLAPAAAQIGAQLAETDRVRRSESIAIAFEGGSAAGGSAAGGSAAGGSAAGGSTARVNEWPSHRREGGLEGFSGAQAASELTCSERSRGEPRLQRCTALHAQTQTAAKQGSRGVLF